MRRFTWHLVVLTTLVFGGTVHAKSDGRDRAEAHYERAMALLNDGALEAAAGAFKAAISLDAKHAPSYVGLGHIFLKHGELDSADVMFRQALRKRKRYAPAFNGLGLTYRDRPKQLRNAINAFRDALRADKQYVEAQYNLAQTYQRFGSSETFKAYRKVVEMDPDHPDAFFQIGRIEETNGEFEKAERAYRDQIAVREDHYGARLHLGVVLKLLDRTGQAINQLLAVIRIPNPHQRRAVLELADVYQRRRDFDQAQATFEAYISLLEPAEQRLYYDLRLVARNTEDTVDLPLEELKAASQTFWIGQDPAPASGANERLVEHYRRVATARESHGQHKFPWDDRGEVYIRFGDPDHVSRSGDVRFETDPRVLAVKDRLIASAGAAAAKLMKDEVRSPGTGRPVVYPGPAGLSRGRHMGILDIYKRGPGHRNDLRPTAFSRTVRIRENARGYGADHENLAEDEPEGRFAQSGGAAAGNLPPDVRHGSAGLLFLHGLVSRRK